MSRAPLLVELGCEELPADAVYSLSEALAQRLGELLEANRFGPPGRPLQRAIFATPRRLAVRFDEVAEVQPERAVERRGPALAAAFDADGAPTRAALGFAQSCGVAIERLERLENDKGSWLYYRSTEPGQALSAVFDSYLNQVIAALPCPKRMRWGDGEVTFLRPALWLCALHGEQLLPASCLGLAAGRQTRGHRFHAPAPVDLASAAHYETSLRERFVEPDDRARRRRIVEQIEAIAERHGAQLSLAAERLNDPLVRECAALVEWPVAIEGGFDPQFLAVPAEALIQTMRDDQRYFALFDRASGDLLPRFITVANIESREPALIRHGNERVIAPRLADAQFFWQQDRKTPLAAHLPALKTVIFQEKLGSLHDRTERLVRLSRHIAAQLGADALLCERAARLSKCDLMTQTVYEFPDMQGVAGRHLVHAEGESAAVAEALEQQYWPRHNLGFEAPTGIIAQVLAIADKLDTLAGIFGIGQRPSGTKDPFALRRAALGLLHILISRRLDLDLAELLDEARTALADRLEQTAAVDTALPYILDRLRAYPAYQDVEPAVIDAVLAKGLSRPLDIDRRILAVSAFRALPEAESLAAASKRVNNILKKADQERGEVRPEQLREAPERALFDALQQVSGDFEAQCAKRHYEQALRALAALRDPVDHFFDRVMVNAEDPALRANRLALLRRLRELCGAVADLSRLG